MNKYINAPGLTDHRSGAPRELLCGKCNTGIGMLCENIRVLNAAISYLVRHGNAGV